MSQESLMDKSFDLQSFLKKHEKKHKNKPEQFQSVACGVKRRLENSLRYRKSTRLSILDSKRNLSPLHVPKPISETAKNAEHRKKQMEKWKEEKERKKRAAAANKKKPFLTGIVHQPLKYEPPPPLKIMPSRSGVTTRSQSIKACSSHSVQTSTNSVKSNMLSKLTVSKSNTRSKSKQTEKPLKATRPTKSAQEISLRSCKSTHDVKSLDLSNINKKNKTTRKSKQNKNELTIPKDKIPKSESITEERLRSPKSHQTCETQDILQRLSIEKCLVSRKFSSVTPKTPEQLTNSKNISPCVTLSRGKDNARKEMKKKMEEGLLDDDTSNMQNVDNFRSQLDSEVKRITEMCDKWEKISHQDMSIPETAMEMLLGAVGQGRLLVSQKLAQFASLVTACECPEPGAPLVTPADLHGFWDMVFMQVENIDMRYKELEELRDRKWQEEAPVVLAQKVVKVVRKKPKSAATSRLRDFITAARKANIEQDATKTELAPNTDDNSKSFEAGFFSVRSPVKSPHVLTTPNKGNLLKNVLSNEAVKASASKNSAASLAMLRASLIGRNVESTDTTASEIITTPTKDTMNLTATPGKSILKSTNIASAKRRKSRKKSMKVVLFNDSDMDSQEIKEDNSGVEISEPQNVSGYPVFVFNSDLKGSNKENKKNKAKLLRQSALDSETQVLTRSRRKSIMEISGNIENKRRSRRIKEKSEDGNENTPK